MSQISEIKLGWWEFPEKQFNLKKEKSVTYLKTANSKQEMGCTFLESGQSCKFETRFLRNPILDLVQGEESAGQIVFSGSYSAAHKKEVKMWSHRKFCTTFLVGLLCSCWYIKEQWQSWQPSLSWSRPVLQSWISWELRKDKRTRPDKKRQILDVILRPVL